MTVFEGEEKSLTGFSSEVPRILDDDSRGHPQQSSAWSSGLGHDKVHFSYSPHRFCASGRRSHHAILLLSLNLVTGGSDMNITLDRDHSEQPERHFVVDL